MARAVPLCSGHELVHRAELVVAREDHRLLGDELAVGLLLAFSFELDEAAKNAQPHLGHQDFIPKVVGVVSVRIRRVARFTLVPFVEREEEGLRSR